MKYYLQVTENNEIDTISQNIRIEVASKEEAIKKAISLKESMPEGVFEFITWRHDEGLPCEKEILNINSVYDIWHDEMMSIQLIFKLEKQAEFIIDNPDFATKIQMAELPVIIENGFVYVYANYILPEDKEKLENPKYEIIINEK